MRPLPPQQIHLHRAAVLETRMRAVEQYIRDHELQPESFPDLQCARTTLQAYRNSPTSGLLELAIASVESAYECARRPEVTAQLRQELAQVEAQAAADNVHLRRAKRLIEAYANGGDDVNMEIARLELHAALHG